MTLRRAGVAVALCAVALGACTSSPARRAGSRPPLPTGTTAGAPTRTAPTSPPTLPPTVSAAAAQLDKQLRAGVASVRSVHVEITTRVAGQALAGTGDERLASGVPVAMHLTERLPAGGSFELVIAGGRSYAKLPPSVYKTAKAWVLISATSPSAAIKQLAAAIESTRSTASLDSITQLIGSAAAVHRLGPRAIGGVGTTHYSVVVEPARLPAGYPGRNELVAAGLKTIPVDVDVDASGRPVRIAETVTAGGATVSTTMTLSRFNRPVTINAPPADQVGST